MQAILLLILAIGLAGCTSDDKFEQVGLYSNESFTKLKKDYIAATGYETNDDLVDRLGNMLAVAENNDELTWSSSRLFETLAESNEYQSILAYTEQLKQRGLNEVMMANVLYTEANTYNVLSKNRWAEKFGVEQPYRNYENLRNAIKSYESFLTQFPKDKRVPQAKKELVVLKNVLKSYNESVKKLNAASRYL